MKRVPNVDGPTITMTESTDREATSIRVYREEKQAAESVMFDGESWNDFIRRLSEEPPEFVAVVPTDDIDPDALAERYTGAFDWSAFEEGERDE